MINKTNFGTTTKEIQLMKFYMLGSIVNAKELGKHFSESSNNCGV